MNYYHIEIRVARSVISPCFITQNMSNWNKLYIDQIYIHHNYNKWNYLKQMLIIFIHNPLASNWNMSLPNTYIAYAWKIYIYTIGNLYTWHMGYIYILPKMSLTYQILLED